ncbi:hypothetical protein HHI36_002398 [Cryptolaemus montrouzieri]|uniref:G-protein coupled receptors family 1 profile domain-containing protein n=1 Tax=Cryptolaemus montrouzieri TaxID=559131 RepID=A0ABD2PAZ0_9CUCU
MKMIHLIFSVILVLSTLFIGIQSIEITKEETETDFPDNTHQENLNYLSRLYPKRKAEENSNINNENEDDSYLSLDDYLDSAEKKNAVFTTSFDYVEKTTRWKRQEENETSDELATYNQTFGLEDIEQYIFPKPWTWVLIFFHFLVFIVGIVGNFLVCVAVYRNHTMRTVTNYFIVNLAVADFLVILFCLPPSVVWDVTSTWFFGIFMCKTVLYFQVS